MSNGSRITKVVPESDAYRGKGRFNDGVVRDHVYVDENGNPYPSVTTILNTYEDEQKEKALENWRNKNDGSGDTEHHETILKYSQLRGTICHAKAQEKYADRELWGDEEESAKKELEKFGEFYGEDADKRCKRECEWFVDEIHSLLDPHIAEVMYVEQYVYSSEPIYAGQSDMVYKDTNDNIIVCDFKTSKHCSLTYFMQLSAYARVIEQELGQQVDKLQVCRANPEEKSTELHTLNREEDSIILQEIVETEYGDKVAIQSPYEAKQDINNLIWDLHHQEWDSEREQWLITINNKNNTTTIDLAVSELAENGWTVDINPVKEQLQNHPEVDDSDLHLHKFNNKYDSHWDMVLQKFLTLAKEYEQEYLPIELLETPPQI